MSTAIVLVIGCLFVVFFHKLKVPLWNVSGKHKTISETLELTVVFIGKILEIILLHTLWDKLLALLRTFF